MHTVYAMDKYSLSRHASGRESEDHQGWMELREIMVAVETEESR